MVQVSWEDAAAFASWAGKRLPTEAEWEYAARGGLTQKPYAWGEAFRPEGKIMANTWQGNFPDRNAKEDGWERTAPVASFPPNGFGLFDMAGNVWNWCADWYRPDYYAKSPSTNPPGPSDSFDPMEPGGPEARPARRLVPLQRPVLLPLHARRAGEGGRRHRLVPRRVPLRPLPRIGPARPSTSNLRRGMINDARIQKRPAPCGSP